MRTVDERIDKEQSKSVLVEKLIKIMPPKKKPLCPIENADRESPLKEYLAPSSS